MTTTTQTKTIDQVLVERKFKKVTSGQWLSEDKNMAVYAYGPEPTTGWKVFFKEGSSYKAMPGGSGNGPDDLVKFLRENTL